MGLKEFDTDTIITIVIYKAVRNYGSDAWESNKKAKESGENIVFFSFQDMELKSMESTIYYPVTHVILSGTIEKN